jgi:putative peptidoglycan lipid II flippase
VTNLHGFDVWRVVLSSLPRSLTLSVSQLAFLVLIGIASTLAAGSIAIFNLSFNLQSVPLAIVGVSYSLAAFPALSRMFAAGKKEAFLEEITTAARHIIFWSLPATVLFMVLRAQIVRTVLGPGQFDWVATRLTAAALALFVLSVSAQSLSLLFARGYYAMGHTKKPLLAAITGAIGMSAFAYLLLQAYDHYPVFVYVFEDVFNVMGVPGTRVLMLPLAYSLGIILNALVLWLFFRQEFKGFTHRFGESLWQSLASSIIAGYASYLALDIFDEVFNLKTLPGVFLQGICAGIVGVIVAGLVLCMLDNKEIAEMIGTFRRRFWKKPEVVGPDVEEL